MEFCKEDTIRKKKKKKSRKTQKLYETQKNLWLLYSGTNNFLDQLWKFPYQNYGFLNVIFFPSYLTGKTVIAFGTIGSGNYSHIILRGI